jgi:RNA polymerase sigma factor (sigma-70 family)
MSSNREQIAMLAKQHDQEAFAELFTIAYDSCLIRARKMTSGNVADAEEIATDASSMLHVFLEKWAPSRTNFFTFFETCSRNAMLNSLRKLRKRSHLSLDSISDSELTSPSSSDWYSGEDEEPTDAERVAMSAIKELSPSQRDIVEMVIHGATIRDIANETEASDDDVRRRLKSAVKYISFELRTHLPDWVSDL